MRHFSTIALLACIGFAATSSIAAAESPAAPAPSVVKFTPSGQYSLRFRAESRDKSDWTNDKSHLFFRHRARIGLKAEWEGLTFFGQLQDVRLWGSETHPLKDFAADALDLHQAWLKVDLAEGLSATVGRQELVVFNHRLMGNVGWIEQAQSFDALRLTYRGEDKKLFIDAFYAPLMTSVSSADGRRADITALAASYKVSKAFVPELTVIMDWNGSSDMNRFTAGLRFHGGISGVSYDAEGYYQGGSMGPDDAQTDISAFLAAAHARYTVDVSTKPFFELFGEFLSGDDDIADDTVKTFNTLYATNHKFYGEMDFFLNIPVNTAQKGLMDVGAVAGFSPNDSLKVQLTAHMFSAMEDRGDEAAFGTELDLRFSWKLSSHLKYDVLYGVFLPGDGLANGADADAEAKHFVYSTMSGTF